MCLALPLANRLDVRRQNYYLTLTFYFRHPPRLPVQFLNLKGATQSSDSFDLYEYLGDSSWG